MDKESSFVIYKNSKKAHRAAKYNLKNKIYYFKTLI